MRDNHDGMPEIIDAFKENEHFFGVVAIEIEGLRKKLRIGISQRSYLALKRVLQLQPFDKMPGLEHRYFFSHGSYRMLDFVTKEIGDCEITIRVEQGKTCKNFSLPAPKGLMQNLNWLLKIKDFEEVAYLPEIK